MNQQERQTDRHRNWEKTKVPYYITKLLLPHYFTFSRAESQLENVWKWILESKAKTITKNSLASILLLYVYLKDS